jgi:hypothetical protein
MLWRTFVIYVCGGCMKIAREASFFTGQMSSYMPLGEGSATMNKRIETTITILAAFFVLLSAMFDVRITLVLAIIFLIALTIYHSIQTGKRRPHRLV